MRKILVFVVLAIAFAGADLVEKAFDPTEATDFHARSLTWAIGSAALVATAALLSRLSLTVSLSAGVMAGGILGNLASALAFQGRVPNPIVVGNHIEGVAFNLADIFTIMGIGALTVSISVLMIQHRHRLLPPRAWERALWRRLGL